MGLVQAHTILHKNTLNKYWTDLKRDIPKKFKPPSAPPTTRKYQKKISKAIADILYKYKYDNTDEDMDIFYHILDDLSEYAAAPEVVKRFKIGTCVRSILSASAALDQFDMQMDDLFMKQKHIIFTSLMCIDMSEVGDGDGDVKYNKAVRNKSLFYALNKSHG